MSNQFRVESPTQTEGLSLDTLDVKMLRMREPLAWREGGVDPCTGKGEAVITSRCWDSNEFAVTEANRFSVKNLHFYYGGSRAQKT